MQQLRCPNCNGLVFNEEPTRYVCAYCGGVLMKDPSRIAARVNMGSSADMLLARADAYWGMGQKDKARSLYRQVLDLDPMNSRARQRS